MDHEDLDVYNAALDFVSFAQDAIKRMPGGRRGLDDQLMRAATSMPLNIAEGAGDYVELGNMWSRSAASA